MQLMPSPGTLCKPDLFRYTLTSSSQPRASRGSFVLPPLLTGLMPSLSMLLWVSLGCLLWLQSLTLEVLGLAAMSCVLRGAARGWAAPVLLLGSRAGLGQDFFPCIAQELPSAETKSELSFSKFSPA